MTTEDDFQAALDANPSDWQTRLVFADWLQDRGDERAEGYRALGARRLYPRGNHIGSEWYWWTARGSGAWGPMHRLPTDWFVAMAGYKARKDGDMWRWPHIGLIAELGQWRRRMVEDRAARAFAKLPNHRRRKLLAS